MEEKINLFDEENGRIKECKRGFTGVWIPAEILLDPNLKATDKIVYAEIASFPRGCWKRSAELAQLAGVAKNAFVRICQRLEESGYITQRRVAGGFILRRTTLGFRSVQKPVEKKSLKPKMKPPETQNGYVSETQNGSIHIENNIENKKNTQYICSSELEHTEKTEQKSVVVKKENPVKDVIDFWNETFGIKMKTNDLNVYALKRLIKTCGGNPATLKKVISVIPIQQKEKGQYALRISDFVELEMKWNKLMAWIHEYAERKEAEREREREVEDFEPFA